MGDDAVGEQDSTPVSLGRADWVKEKNACRKSFRQAFFLMVESVPRAVASG
jgi:hypothetical protein